MDMGLAKLEREHTLSGWAMGGVASQQQALQLKRNALD
jgi:hypothetical protein